MKNTTRLYPTPSFLEGIARLVDVTGSLNTYNCTDNPELDDQRSLESDWDGIVPSCESDSLVARAAKELSENLELRSIVKITNKDFPQ
jgi:hypothetical protein